MAFLVLFCWFSPIDHDYSVRIFDTVVHHAKLSTLAGTRNHIISLSEAHAISLQCTRPAVILFDTSPTGQHANFNGLTLEALVCIVIFLG